jgi:hypothetical protein
MFIIKMILLFPEFSFLVNEIEKKKEIVIENKQTKEFPSCHTSQVKRER